MLQDLEKLVQPWIELTDILDSGCEPFLHITFHLRNPALRGPQRFERLRQQLAVLAIAIAIAIVGDPDERSA